MSCIIVEKKNLTLLVVLHHQYVVPVSTQRQRYAKAQQSILKTANKK